MSQLSNNSWKAFAIILSLITMVGCQGFSTGKAASPSTAQSASAAGLNAVPASVNFGNTQIGKSQTQSGTVSNTGGSNTTISAITTTGAGFTISGLSTPVTLAPGQSATFKVAFAPQSSGSFTGSVVITSDASASNLNIVLSGSGTLSAVGGQLSVSPSTINVGSVNVGSSGLQTGTLSATGADVSVSSADVGSSEFTISGLSFPLTVAPGQSVNFTVTFTPQTAGAASAGVSFTSNASNSPASSTATGTGVAGTSYSVNLSWNASTSPNVTGYNVYRRSGTGGSFSRINTVLDPNTLYLDTSVSDGLTYYYETTAVNSTNEESGPSAIVQAIIPPQ
jgi:hypothetical protein